MIQTKVRTPHERFLYLKEVLGILCEIELAVGGEPFRPTVDLVDDGIARIEFEGECLLLVDLARAVTDDPFTILPEGFPGVLPVLRRYRVSWRDCDDLPMQETVGASSRRFARLFVGAPMNAYVERV